MPRLVRGGKWVYGWVIVSPEREIPIPPQAWQDYAFAVGDAIVFLRGSQSSGGFAIARAQRMAEAFGPLGAGRRVLGRGVFAAQGSAALPSAVQAGPGDRLLAVRGSGLGLGFVARGPIYDEALRHPELTQLS